MKNYKMKNLITGLMLVFASCLFVVLVAEIVLRFMPVNSGLKAQAVNQQNPVFRFAANRDFVYSRDWDMVMVNHGHVNNLGFVNDTDYVADHKKPLLAIIGDSYIEALMVPYESTVQGRLAAQIGDKGSVYSFAASGAPLSQYAAWFNYAEKTFQPDGAVFVVVGNDYDESLMKYKQGPGFHHYEENPATGELVSKRVDYQPDLVRQMVSYSAFVRYLYINLNAHVTLKNLWSAIWQSASREETVAYVDNVRARTSAQVISDSKRGVDAFLQELLSSTTLDPASILIVLKEMQRSIKDPEFVQADQDSYVGHMRRYLMEQARDKGFEVLDMQAPMQASYARDRLAFDYPRDAHWNDYAHGEAAKSIQTSRLYQRLFAAE